MNELFYQLATRRITSEATPEELRQLEEILQDPERKKEFEQLEAAWKEAAKVEMKSYAQQDWKQVEQKINAPKQVRLKSSRTRLIMGIAASLVMAIAAGIWLLGPMSYTHIEATAGNKEVLLPDQSIVTLKEGSSIAYKNNFQSDRSVKLEGQAFFKVAKDPAHPFVISTAGSKTTVLGTAFDIKENKILKRVQIHVKEGKVRFEGKASEIILEKGMAAEYNEGSGKVESIDFGTGNKVNWQEGRLIFEDTPIKDVIQDMSEFFNVEIELENENLNCGFTTTAEHANWDALVQAIEIGLNLKFEKIAPGKWIVKGGNC